MDRRDFLASWMGAGGLGVAATSLAAGERYGFYLGGACQHCQIVGTVKDNAAAGTGGAGAGDPVNLVMVNG